MKQPPLTPAALIALASGGSDNLMVAATPGGIEAQEARGQQQFVASESLPKQCPREALERLGFKFGADVDDLFVNVTMPDGWTKRSTGHSMWSDLLDDKGRKRGSIFYKAAFYDRNARMDLDRRYGPTQEYPKDPTEAIGFYVKDWDGTILFEAGQVKACDYPAQEDAGKRATAWLEEQFPRWKDPLEYWD